MYAVNVYYPFSVFEVLDDRVFRGRTFETRIEALEFSHKELIAHISMAQKKQEYILRLIAREKECVFDQESELIDALTSVYEDHSEEFTEAPHVRLVFTRDSITLVKYHRWVMVINRQDPSEVFSMMSDGGAEITKKIRSIIEKGNLLRLCVMLGDVQGKLIYAVSADSASIMRDFRSIAHAERELNEPA